MPATSDYWVNDMRGDPLFVVTAQANAGLVTMLPGILEEIRSLLGKRTPTFKATNQVLFLFDDVGS
jgi:hypothetical protein